MCVFIVIVINHRISNATYGGVMMMMKVYVRLFCCGRILIYTFNDTNTHTCTYCTAIQKTTRTMSCRNIKM